ncbi:MAG: arsenic efflux protein [Bacteroidales bacterium]|nr:arsenic efflux protein [Bacteroidales bacterium]
MLENLYLILQQTLIITAFVIGMMIIIEFINVKTGGLWSKKLQASPWVQIMIGALMGVIPGCLGTYTIVSLYIHRVVNFPALIATLIATAGDEAFFMFSLFPGNALKITVIIFVLAIIIGAILQLTMKNKFIGLSEKSFPLHENEPECHHHHHEHTISKNFKNFTFVRALLVAMCVMILGLILSGVINGEHQLNLLMGGQSEETVIEAFQEDAHLECCEHHHEEGHHHDHEGEADWIRYTLIAMFSAILLIVIVAKEHFLQEHIWEHVIKVHLPKVFLWTLSVILALTIVNYFIDIQGIVTKNPYIVLLIAILIGIIPQSGPHLIFVLLFAQGTIPLSILLASSIVQDGHGALPLLAESQKAFLLSKGIKIVLGIAVGIIGLAFGF